jgi:hypothetical protein
MLNWAILYRRIEECIEEEKILENTLSNKYCNFRSDIPRDTIVVGRYSVLPFYSELYHELKNKNSYLINDIHQHEFIANMEYIQQIKDFTPKTWTEWGFLPEGEYVVKGKTNSRKFQWKQQMYAPNKKEVVNVVKRLMDDSLIRDQGIVVREYIPLRQFDIGINDLPITNEWRAFVCYGKIVDYGYYWANFEECKPYDQLPDKAINLLHEVIDILKKFANFFVLDIAETRNGDWIVIEMNDGQMSGLSMINANRFYERLNIILNEK